MRLPLRGEQSVNVDEEQTQRMLHYAIDQGVNYVDTAYTYHGGVSELVVGRALQNGYRERVKLATKLPQWLVAETKDFDKYLNEQLDKLQTEHIDFYLVHALGQDSWQKMRELDLFSWAERAKRDGRIGQLGFSSHAGYETFVDIVDGYDDWAFCQIQYNFMDVDTQAGTQGLQYAAAKGLAVVIMEPLLGGRLVDPPERVQAIWDEAPVERSSVDWALRWLWNQPEVSVVLSGMSAMTHVEENVASADASGQDTLSDEELALYGRVRKAYQDLCPIPCTECKYCMPCPEGVNIPFNLLYFNRGVLYGNVQRSRFRYRGRPQSQLAISCVGCRECEDKCPQSILISEWMPLVHEVLAEGGDYDPERYPQS
jgi:predicted aldo/keto reductase-like oxidoreductase